ncbi:MAG TPA: bifunctional precorrin-2 dehydrogenase/sirohydrochlorin ferrochelatase [Methanothrix sp.]|jgi:precorrin-2 dehydrogenase/sirohydrochlorin ferrochelatase|uniref:precorrin-2 dehydrogenase/sirohydrochlorin ferrochelatase family protein n=1 Tax=Methanothrix sp. TaxID=90426 RepID=UPI002B87FE51|nr:bifunctional precorrin-2 dehydrogenase/sirohydrochlorin ferrochelatase [Methanothrix sp.]MDI9418300.1 bifunctional precorrin-2 dehydrogenase/sirohydrochlorin ferrochelatase [Euryarchaeota archaeon]HON35142.1 bifunctional precorrin-2 dehydrogenase/sirohydrochlorin ferrochelatase [Methanothrix sp.]HRU74682.1 bifunctional precorrin-2 dehydrogenase/sirohydrochlorin ferrochelatase [Methanothrix sp.]
MAGSDDHSSYRPLLPLYLDMSHRRVVIFGGGRVAERKAALFSDYGPVQVVSQSFTPALLASKDRWELTECDLRADFKRYLQGAFIAVPATSNTQLNRSIEEEAVRMGVLVNRVEGRGEVVVPSIIRKGQISIAISTEAPGLTRYLRLRLEEELTEDYQGMARLLSRLRPELKEALPRQVDRARVIRSILEDEEVWRLLGVSNEKAYMRARSHACQDERDSLDAGDSPHRLHRGD